ncbi:MAG TPA: hypothetical protein VF517_15285 [Thermoleophilaceae bacterium]
MKHWLHRLTWWSGLQLLAAITGIAGFVVTLVGDLSRTQRLTLGIITVCAVTAIALTALLTRRRPLLPVKREEMVAKGRSLLAHEIKYSAVLFAGDMSWAPEYCGPIADAVARGKQVTVIYPRDKTGAAISHNAAMLGEVGARVVPVITDTRLRAMLIDRENPDQALLFVVNPRRDMHVRDFGHSTTGDVYEGKVYAWKEDRVLIATATKLYEVLDPAGASSDSSGSPQAPSG